jgi:hypothetical protein
MLGGVCMSKKGIINGIITLLVVIFIVVFPILVFKMVPPDESFGVVVLSGITLSVVISLLFRLNIGGLFYTAILLSHNQQKQVIKQYPILNILYGIIIINFVILLKYVIFMTFLTEPTMFWKIVLFTIFMIV